MKRMNLVLAMVAALIGTALAGTALAQDEGNAFQTTENPSVLNAQQYGRGGDSGQNHDNGWGNNNRQGWGDSGRSRDNGWGNDNRQGWGDRGRFQGQSLDGRWVIDDRDAAFHQNGFGGRGMMRELMLPGRISIDQSPSLVRILDRRNRQLQLITLGGKFGNSRGGDYVAGRFHGNTLVVEHDGARATITQTFALQNGGRTLVVTTRREGFGPRTVEFVSTYHRA